MLGKKSDQRGLWEVEYLYLDLAGRDSFCGRLAGLQGQLFRDEDFAALYCRDNGRSSVKPSLPAFCPEHAAAYPGATGAVGADARAHSAQPGIGAGAGPAAGLQPASSLGPDAHLGPRGGEGHLQSATGC